MRLLLTNDDGIEAEGLALLESVARRFSDDVWVVAPASNQSSCGRAITQTRKVACDQLGDQRYAIGGTPGDCAIIALNGLIPGKRPDVVLSGVNRGSNLGEDIALSGTVGACLQAWEQGVSAIAFSQVLANFTARPTNWQGAEAFLEQTLQRFLKIALDEPGVLNVNFPPLDDVANYRGTVLAAPGIRLLPLSVKSEVDATGQCWYDYRSLRNKREVSENSDIDLAYRGHITVSPLTHTLHHDARVGKLESIMTTDTTASENRE